MQENKHTNKSVAIIGCGWLGQALTKQLLADSYHVVGTSQSIERLEQIALLGAQAEKLTLPLNEADNMEYQCFQCQSLVIAITPQLRTGNADYPEKIAQIVAKAKQGKVEQIILINSTAIYGGLVGEISETALLDNSQPKVEALKQAEQKVLESGLAAVSLRVAGLVGPNRHPGNFFKNGRMLKEPNAYVNLVHQADIVQCIARIIELPDVTGIYNVASNIKVKKEVFYRQAALSLSNKPPKFEADTSSSSGKFIVSDKIRQALAIQFEYDDLVMWLNTNGETK